MSLAAQVEAARTIPINPAVTNRILIVDVERLDGITQEHFWDRGDLKNRYVHAANVIREPRTTILCAKWYDEPDVIRLTEWDKGGRKAFLKNIHNLLSQADILVGHYLDNADVPWVKGDLHFPRIGHPLVPKHDPLPPFKTVDTYKVLRQQFKAGAPFKSLDAVCKILGLPSKIDTYDRERMERAAAGSLEDRERLTDYCAGDVIATQWLYDWERPHIKNHPHLFVTGEDKLRVCNRCGSTTKDVAKRYVANVLTYTMRKCPECGGYSRLSIEPERMSIVRGV